MVNCACGCGQEFPELDSKGRKRSYARGHFMRVGGPDRMNRWQAPAERRCNGCNQILPIDQFGKHTRHTKAGVTYARYRSMCSSCESGRYPATPEWRMQYREKHRLSIKHFIQNRITTWRKKPGPPSDLTVDFLVDLFNQQEGMCRYTGWSMEFNAWQGKPSHLSLSLDRLTPALGYVQGNVAWCCYLANTMKQNMDETEFFSTLEVMLSVRDERQ